MNRPIAPLRHIPVKTVVDGVELTGEIVFLTPSDLSIVIYSPVSGLGTTLHVPYFAMYEQNWLATYSTSDMTTTAISTRGQERAQGLLKELYDYASGRPSGWGISRVDSEGRWTDIGADALSAKIAETLSAAVISVEGGEVSGH